jgi:hypothetical protein
MQKLTDTKKKKKVKIFTSGANDLLGLKREKRSKYESTMSPEKTIKERPCSGDDTRAGKTTSVNKYCNFSCRSVPTLVRTSKLPKVCILLKVYIRNLHEINVGICDAADGQNPRHSAES